MIRWAFSTKAILISRPVWLTGTSTPCVSLFKPYRFGDPPTAPVFAPGDPAAERYWKDAELKNVPTSYQFRNRWAKKTNVLTNKE